MWPIEMANFAGKEIFSRDNLSKISRKLPKETEDFHSNVRHMCSYDRGGQACQLGKIIFHIFCAMPFTQSSRDFLASFTIEK